MWRLSLNYVCLCLYGMVSYHIKYSYNRACSSLIIYFPEKHRKFCPIKRLRFVCKATYFFYFELIINIGRLNSYTCKETMSDFQRSCVIMNTRGSTTKHKPYNLLAIFFIKKDGSFYLFSIVKHQLI